MINLTQNHINAHCSNLGISRERLIEFTIPDGVTRIGYKAFLDCTSLTSITIPDSVTEIGKEAFEGCTSLQSITILNNVTTIGERAFRECTSLESITIPDSVTEIGDEAFQECTSLKRISCNNSDLFTDDNIDNKNQIEFISIGEHLKTNYPDLLRVLSYYSESSGFNYDHVSSKELNLIVKFHQKDYLPDWNTIATIFNARSIDQILDILKFFEKHSCVCNMMHIYSKPNMTLNGISMFLNPLDHSNLSMTAKNITFKP